MNLFENIQVRRPKKSKFDLSHESKLTMNMGELIPILTQEVLPGDKFRINTELLIRLQPLLAPMYQRVRAYTHFFFVPSRLVWDEFKDFITGGVTGTVQPVHPFVYAGEAARPYLEHGRLTDYMGIPTVPITGPAITNPVKFSALPFRAYQLIYNEYFRDQTLSPEITFAKTSGDQTTFPEMDKILIKRNRAWQKDYFRSALPFAQRGGSVTAPISMAYKPASEIFLEGSTGTISTRMLLGTNLESGPPNSKNIKAQAASSAANAPSGIQTNVRIENIDAASGTTINDLRTSVRLQEWLEKNARGGARYIEQILHHFGVKSSDARLQRPEYLGGGNSPIVISEVLTTFQDPADTGEPAGTMAGHGLGVAGGHGFGNKYFEEHGYIIGVLSVMPKAAYFQGIPKQFSRFDKLDYAWPEFAQLGEQSITDKELYHDFVGTPTSGDGTFGYQSRYAEYKYACDQVHGDFKSSLAYWHQATIFTAKPVLNHSFIHATPDARIFAVPSPTTHKLLVQLYHNISAIRPLPYFGTPTL